MSGGREVSSPRSKPEKQTPPVRMAALSTQGGADPRQDVTSDDADSIRPPCAVVLDATSLHGIRSPGRVRRTGLARPRGADGPPHEPRTHLRRALRAQATWIDRPWCSLRRSLSSRPPLSVLDAVDGATVVPHEQEG